MSRFEFLLEVVGVNEEGTHCHPYKQTIRGQKGKFSYSFKIHNRDFIPATEEELIALIEEGAFDNQGKIRMLPLDSENTKRNGAMRVAYYKGRKLPYKAQKPAISDPEASFQYWWVNHRTTHLDEYKGRYIWSPKKNRNGARNQSYTNLTLVQPGDVVFSYAEGLIKAVGVAAGLYREEPIPESHGQAADYWDKLGWMVPVEWIRLHHPMSPKLHLEVIANLLPTKYSPIRKNGDGNQVSYLSSIPQALGTAVLELIADRNLEVLSTVRRLIASSSVKLEKLKTRLPAEELRKVTPEYIWEAVQVILQGANPDGYRPSVDYDLLVDDGVRLAPKQVFGLAATAALEKDIEPFNFTGGVGTVCFELLEAAGYRIVPKGQQVESVGIPIGEEDKEWAEGQVKLVYHLKRERSPGLSRAKKASFIKQYGRLFCEECGVDPIETYGAYGAACIEVHHEVIQVADMGNGHKTKLDQLRCLCANCHRIVHHRLKMRLLDSAVDSQTQGDPVLENAAR
ncbi:HNH endonuclease [Pseudomonas viridiflava]|uniref:HNH endonuclease n=4 Tax=Pseudomonas viridiflava TaxID=33069 RepID=UPI000F035BB5|nr:hypothetical protein [Pseudomonas viridiflava]